MQIGLLSTSYPRHPHDPAGRFVAELAGWLAETGDTLEVLAPHPARDPHPGVHVRSLRYALRPRLLYGAGAPDNLKRAGAWPQVPAYVTRLFIACRQHSRRWDGVISHWLLPCGLVTSLASRGLPHLAIAHSSDVHLLRRLTAAPLLLWALARPLTQLVLTSDYLRPLLAQIARGTAARQLVDRAAVIRMGIHEHRLVDTSDAERDRRAHPLRQLHGLSHNTVALFVGRLVPVKGVEHLIRACASLEGMTLVIVGDGPERPALERLASRHGGGTGGDAKGQVLFVGQLGAKERDAWLHAADLLVCPSLELPDGRTESAPVVLLEAMASGLPVVASRVGGNPELIQHGTSGILVPPADVSALRTALAALQADEELRRRLGREAIQVARQHSWDHVGARLRRLLEDL